MHVFIEKVNLPNMLKRLFCDALFLTIIQ